MCGSSYHGKAMNPPCCHRVLPSETIAKVFLLHSLWAQATLQIITSLGFWISPICWLHYWGYLFPSAFLSWSLVSVSLMWQFSVSYVALWTMVPPQNLVEVAGHLLQVFVTESLAILMAGGILLWAWMWEQLLQQDSPSKVRQFIPPPGVWLRARRACGSEHPTL